MAKETSAISSSFRRHNNIVTPGEPLVLLMVGSPTGGGYISVDQRHQRVHSVPIPYAYIHDTNRELRGHHTRRIGKPVTFWHLYMSSFVCVCVLILILLRDLSIR